MANNRKLALRKFSSAKLLRLILFLDVPTAEMALEFVKQGGCAMSLYQDMLRGQWNSRMNIHIGSIHMVPIPPNSIAGWNVLTTSPYLNIFVDKFRQMEQAGIMERLGRQYVTAKPVEDGPLEPLKLKHFYIIFLGIVVGMFLALVSFLVECMGRARQSHLQGGIGKEMHRTSQGCLRVSPS